MTPFDPCAAGAGDQRHVDELVAHVDKGVALALATQREIEDAGIPGKCLVDVADLDRDMVDADQPRLFSFRHGRTPSCSRHSLTPPKRPKQSFTAEVAGAA